MIAPDNDRSRCLDQWSDSAESLERTLIDARLAIRQAEAETNVEKLLSAVSLQDSDLIALVG